MSTTEIKNAIIVGTMLGYEDHDIFNASAPKRLGISARRSGTYLKTNGLTPPYWRRHARRSHDPHHRESRRQHQDRMSKQYYCDGRWVSLRAFKKAHREEMHARFPKLAAVLYPKKARK